MTDETSRPTDPAISKLRTVRLDPHFCPPGSGALVAGVFYTVGPDSTLSIPAELSDEALRVDLGATLLVEPKA